MELGPVEEGTRVGEDRLSGISWEKVKGSPPWSGEQILRETGPDRL